MPSIINASTSAGIVQTADTSGILQLQSNGTTIATIGPTGLSTQVGAPAFSAYITSNQSLTSGVVTKVALNAEDFDTANCFDTSAYRFTPNVAGYYQFNLSVVFYSSSTQISTASTRLYKNGSLYVYAQSNVAATAIYTSPTSIVVYANGTTDYFEMYGIATGTNLFVSGDTPTRTTTFSGALIRSA